MIDSCETILVIGLGELGTAILEALLAHPAHQSNTTTTKTTTSLAVLVRPSSLVSPSAEKASQMTNFQSRGVTFHGGDIDTQSQDELTALLGSIRADVVIHAGGMTLARGSQLKLTRAILAAPNVKVYIPWQHGVDYDIIGRHAGDGLFSEQLDVRDLLRSQSRVSWLIISCGIFMSFLFEPFWGVVVREDPPPHGGVGRITKIRALGGWDHGLTATTAEDIGTCTAELLFAAISHPSSAPPLPNPTTTTGNPNGNVAEHMNRAIYIAGDTMTYSQFADLCEQSQTQNTATAAAVAGDSSIKIQRELWETPHLIAESRKDPDNKLLKYRVVFSQDRGLSWPKEETFNAGRGIRMTSLGEFLQIQTYHNVF